MEATQVGTIGYPPIVKIVPIPPKDGAAPAPEATNPEAAKYEALWGKHPEYREVSPGELWSDLFLKHAAPRRDSWAIDFGCGTGRGALMLALFGALKVRMLDFAANCLDPDVENATRTQNGRITFEQHDLTKPIPGSEAPYGYCCDVMEHIPPADVRQVLKNILASAQHVFFGIATAPDKMGELIGEQLHLTVQPMAWWEQQLRELGATIHFSQDFGGEACAIYCSVWRDASDVLQPGKLNVEDALLDEQILANIAGDWLHVQPCLEQDREIVLLAGGPSMREPEQLEEIRRLRAAGCFLVTCNGAYDWALAQGLTVSAQIVLDGREFNARFTRDVRPDTRYLIASQVHPKTLEGLPRDRTYLWHSGVSEAAQQLIREKTGAFWPVPGGSTVVLRALPLLRMLGFKRMHLFGFDSCVMDGRHHAYDQAENDGQQTFPVTCGGLVFQCEPWMLSQASEFRDLTKSMGDEVELDIHGHGLIKQMLLTGDQLAAEAEKGT